MGRYCNLSLTLFDSPLPLIGPIWIDIDQLLGMLSLGQAPHLGWLQMLELPAGLGYLPHESQLIYFELQ